MKEKRPLIKIDAETPGTEVAAEAAAAMASASLVFKDSDPEYSSTLLRHAKQLFDFADTKRGSYSVNVPEVQGYYNSTGYGDELLWAASWLYHATEDKTYLDYVSKNGKEFASFGNPTWFSWDNKLAGTQVRFGGRKSVYLLCSFYNIYGFIGHCRCCYQDYSSLRKIYQEARDLEVTGTQLKL